MICASPEIVEDGFRVLQRQLNTGYGGKLDVLGVDKTGTLTIIELKVEEDDGIFAQALDYFAWVNDNRDSMKRMFATEKVDEKQTPRIILIASSFSDTLRRRVNYLREDISCNLSSYTVIRHKNEDIVLLNEVQPIETSALPPDPPTLESLLNYIQTDDGKKLFTDAIDFINGLKDEIRQNITRNYIGFRHRNSPLIVYLNVRRQGFSPEILVGDKYERYFVSNSEEWEVVKIKINEAFEAYTKEV